MYRVRARLVKIFLWSDIFMVGLIRQTNHAEPYVAMKGVLISLTKTMPLDYAGWHPRLESYFQDGAFKRFPDELMSGYRCMILGVFWIGTISAMAKPNPSLSASRRVFHFARTTEELGNLLRANWERAALSLRFICCASAFEQVG